MTTETLEAFAPPVQECAAMSRIRSEAARFVSVGGPLLFAGEVGTGRSTLARAVALRRSDGRRHGMLVVRGGDGLEHFRGLGSRKQSLVIQELDELHARDQMLLVQLLKEEAVILSASLRDPGRLMPPLRDMTSHLTWTLPALHARQTDCVLWARYFVGHFAARSGSWRLSVDAEDAVQQARLPGNLQQLKAAVERAIAVADGQTIHPADLGPLGMPSDLAPRIEGGPSRAEIGPRLAASPGRATRRSSTRRRHQGG